MSTHADHPPFSFIVGCARSGTTLIRVILNEHSQLAVPGESHFIPRYAQHRSRWESNGSFDVSTFVEDLSSFFRFQRWKVPTEDLRKALEERPVTGFSDAVRRVYATFAAMHDKPRYGDKTPNYVMEVPLLAALFPESQFVHVIRDPRNVALSLREQRFAPPHLGAGALFWRKRVTAAREAGAILPAGTYYEYRHEDLVADPETVVEGICAFLNLPYEPQMLQYHEKPSGYGSHHTRHLSKPPTKGLRDWTEQMTVEELRIVEILVGDLMGEFGYEPQTNKRSAPAKEGKIQREAARIRRQQEIWEENRFYRRMRPPGAARRSLLLHDIVEDE